MSGVCLADPEWRMPSETCGGNGKHGAGIWLSPHVSERSGGARCGKSAKIFNFQLVLQSGRCLSSAWPQNLIGISLLCFLVTIAVLTGSG